MKPKAYWRLIVAGVTAALGVLSSAHALSIGDSNYVGWVSPSNVNPAGEVALINKLTDGSFINPGDGTISFDAKDYNRDNGIAGPFGEALTTAAGKYDNLGAPYASSYDISGYNYVVGKYNGAAGGILVWYNPEGFGSSEVIPETFNNKGLSHVSYYKAVGIPDGGTSVVLLGLALLGLGGVRRIASRKA